MSTSNKCWHGRCKWLGGSVCTHPKAIMFNSLSAPCVYCGRKPNDHKKGCGECVGRGTYTYPTLYEDCDCGGYEKSKR